jgi:hypothetical protein
MEFECKASVLSIGLNEVIIAMRYTYVSSVLPQPLGLLSEVSADLHCARFSGSMERGHIRYSK